jgi:hypothetical protein
MTSRSHSTDAQDAIEESRAAEAKGPGSYDAEGLLADLQRDKVRAAQAHLVELSAMATRESQDLERLKPLIAKDEISRQQYDAAVEAQEAAQAAVESAKASVSEAQANVAVSEARRAQSASVVAQAQAQTQAAETAPQQVAMTRAHAQTADAQVLQLWAEEARLARANDDCRGGRGGSSRGKA